MMFERVVYGNVKIGDLILAFMIILFASVLARTVSLYIKRSLKHRLDENNLKILTRISNYGIIILALLIVLPLVGVNLSGLIVAGGMTGLIVGFASQKIVSNLISGLFLMIEKPIRIGQWVNIDGQSGAVVDLSIISTIIRTYDSLYVRIPNETVFTNTIINFTANTVRRINYTVGIRYSDDAGRAIEVIRKVLDSHPFAMINPSPQIFVDSLGDNSVNIVVRVWAPTSEWFDTKMNLLWKIKKGIEEEGIQIPFPQRTVWFANELKENRT